MALFRQAFLALVHAYRLLVSPILPPTCRFEPTCSAYGLEAIRRFGVGAGGWLTLRRLLRCHPWGGSGFDPVPEAPHMPSTGCAACGGGAGGRAAAAGPGAAP
jgi:putative membrane protein insertion efficiency factor